MLNKAANACCPPRRRGRPARDEAAVSREEVLTKAFAAFAREGYDQVSVRSLAAACGVSDSLLHHHFGSKEQLWFAAADSVFGPIYQRLLGLLDSLSEAQQGDAVAILQNNLPAALKLVAADPQALQFLFREAEGDNARAAHLRHTYLRPYLARLDVLFEQAVATGRYRVVSAASRHALVFGLLRSIVIPGAMCDELAPHLASPQAISNFIDDAVTVLYHGLALSPQEQQASRGGAA